jgi:hypothetical protein
VSSGANKPHVQGANNSAALTERPCFHSFLAALPQDLLDYSALQHWDDQGKNQRWKTLAPGIPATAPNKGKEKSSRETQFISEDMDTHLPAAPLACDAL